MKDLNPNIRRVVEIMRAAGFDTTDSGDGETHDFGCDLGTAYVHARVPPERLADEARRLMQLFESRGIRFTGLGEDGQGSSVEASYSPVDGCAVVSIFGVNDRQVTP